MSSSSPPIPARSRDKQLGNPVHHVHAGKVPAARMPISFALLLNLVGVASTDDKDLLWGFVRRYAPGASPETHPELDALIDYALAYFRDFVAGSLSRRPPDEREAGGAARPRCSRARRTAGGRDPAEAIQNEVYEVGKATGFEQPARLVQGALRNPARHRPGPAHGQLHRALRHRQQPQADRRGAGVGLTATARAIRTADAPAAPRHRLRARDRADLRPPPCCRAGNDERGCGPRRSPPW